MIRKGSSSSLLLNKYHIKSIDFFDNMLYNIGEGDDTDGRNKVEEYQTV